MSEQDADRLLRACREHDLVECVRVIDEVGSTQDEALVIAREHGRTLVIARHQTAGRGRLGRDWHETPGLGLACTFALQGERVDPDELSARVAVACAHAIEHAGLPHARIKWPNDIVDTHARKLAGVLIEIRDSWALLGTGFNVNHRPEHFPEHIRDRSASLAMLGVETDPISLAETLIGALHRALIEPFEDTLKSWRERDALVGTKRSFVVGNQTITGTVESLHPSQEIAVRTRNGVESLDPRIAQLVREGERRDEATDPRA